MHGFKGIFHESLNTPELRISKLIIGDKIIIIIYNNNNNNNNNNSNNNILTGKLYSLGGIFMEVLCIKYIIVIKKIAGFK